MADEKDNKNQAEAAEEQVEGAEGEEGAAEEGASGKKGKKKIILLLIFLFVLIGSSIGVLFFLGFFDQAKKYVVAEQHEISEDEVLLDEDGNPIVKQVIYYDLEEFIVNLSVGSQRPSFLKMTVSLELPSEAQIPGIELKLPRIRDSFQIYLRELRVDDLQGSAGIYRLREELLLRINKIVYPNKVNDILFKDIIIQ